MASLTNTKIKNTYVSLLKVADNGQLDGTLQDITDGAGNTSGVQLNTGGDLAASGTVSFGSLKDSSENITITKFVDAADGISGNDNDTTIPTSAAIKAYVDSNITAQDLDIAGDSGTGAVDLDSQTFTISGTTNEVVTAVSGQTVTIGLPSSITVDVTGNLTGNVSGNVTGNLTGNVSGNVTGDVTGDLTGNVTATSVLVDGVTATTQTIGDNSTKVATTAYVDAAITAEDLDFSGDSGSGSIDLDSETLTIAGTANEIETSATGNTLTVGLPSDVIIGNDLTVTTDASVGGTLDVTGATGVDGNFDVATNKFTVQAATGNTAVAGTLGVTGNTTLSTVDVTGLASLDGGIDVDGAFTVADSTGNISTSGTLGVTGTSTLGVINASGLASLDGGIDVDGAFTVADTTGNISTTGSITAATGTINGLLDVVGEVQATFLDINGNGEVSGNLAVDTDTLFVDSTNDRVGINKTNPAVALDVTGDITSSGTVTGTTLTGTLSTAAQTNITSVGTLSSLTVSGALNGTISTAAQPNITSVGTLSSLTTSGNLGVGTSLETWFTGLGTKAIQFGDVGSLWSLNNGASDLRTVLDCNLYLNGSGTPTYLTTGLATRYQQIGGTHRWSTGISGTADTDANLSESMRIDTSGNVGIGTSSPTANLQVLKSGSGTYLKIGGDDVGGGRSLVFTSSDTSSVGTTHTINASSLDGVIALATGGTERMRITSGGYLKASNNGTYFNSSSTFSEFSNSTTTNPALFLSQTNTSFSDNVLFLEGYRNTTNDSWYFLSGYNRTTSAYKFRIADSGDITNTNNSYGAISDIKLKENVVDASPKLEELLQVKVRNFNYIGDDKKQLGVVAQELEEVFPSMISESPDIEEQEVIDEEGNVTTQKVNLGTTTKSVKYSVFVPMLIKAMQEQQEIIQSQGDLIEGLKARIETLENK